MSDERSRSVLDRVSKWLGRKKETNTQDHNPEENGIMPADQNQDAPSSNPSGNKQPGGDKKEPAAVAAGDGNGDTSEAAKKTTKSPSARRREQRARAKERAAKAAANGETPPAEDKPAAAESPVAEAKTAGAAKASGGRGKGRGTAKAATKAGDKSAAKPTAKKPAKEAAAKSDEPAAKAKTAKSGGGKKSAAAAATKSTPKAVVGTSYKLLINTDEPEECRLALVENGKVEGFYIESTSGAQCKGNIYKGRITSVEANLQAAFVDIGLPKNGFLSFSEIHPEYYEKEVDPDTNWKSLKIQDMVKKGREVLVEVVKDATGNKGPSLTTYLSLPGRCLVLMPGSDSAGISRKIDDEEQRRKLREMVEGLNIPEGIGYIIRTASQEITKTALSQDMRFLLNLWTEIKKKGQSTPAPALLYKEQNIIARFLRDHYTTDIKEILVDNEEAAEQVKNFLQLLPAAQRKKTTVKLHQGSQPIFHQYHVEKQIEQMFQPTVPLSSGGSIVINPTEALVAIDVNSGRTASKDRDFEESIFIANMEAAEELARQLRMRDLGGLIVVDFIDMRSAANTREVEKKVRECMKKDKAKVDFSRISKFGLMQISRQKMAAPIQSSSYKTCPHCEGRGMIRSVENMVLSYLRQIQTGLHQRKANKVLCRLPLDVAQYIFNKKREDLLELEKDYQAQIIIEADPQMLAAENRIEFLKE
ncbi:Rne/Rng family ribonuclease [Desulfurivibrio alkaliphilus]|uniref:Ribonuclease G n=1 Tax=Desulfurivibrio alkaliphilus (strain DSM 19089 / UNIQEM U267 / AHT2) TaxID=589865 RepID=D6Z6E8_DESAT|nr:Rne/Rng family ribonuclease [Desulfurivibrio alkaliphilus]ADH86913.1 ribonuclease, Rne/Rng family [Desulfurivibrio alkaliphilus AHT 2]